MDAFLYAKTTFFQAGKIPDPADSLFVENSAVIGVTQNAGDQPLVTVIF